MYIMSILHNFLVRPIGAARGGGGGAVCAEFVSSARLLFLISQQAENH